MSWKTAWARVRGLARESGDDLAEEMRSHIEHEIADNLDKGMSPEEARRRAMIRFGNLASAVEETRAMWTLPRLESLLGDLKFGWRMLWKSPGFAIVVVLTLALGTGATTAIFSVAYGVLLRPLPYKDSQRLVLAHQYDHAHDQGNWRSTAFDYLDWSQRTRSFAGMAAYTGRGLAFASAQGAEMVLGQASSANLFDVLGVAPALGRGFRTGEDTAGNDHVVVLSYELWQRRFGGDASVIGRSVTVNALPYTVIGIMPRGFYFPSADYQAWVPFALHGAVDPQIVNRSAHFFRVVARLRDGVSFAQANNDVASVAGQLEKEFPDTDLNESARLQPMLDNVVGSVRSSLWLLLAAALCLLIIACSNVANLLLARATSREREMAVRQALGAAQGRLFRQLLTESVVLVALGAAAGIAVAYGLVFAIVRLGPASLPRLEEIRVDAAALGFACVTAGLTGLVFTLAPMFLVRRMSTADALKSNAKAAGAAGGTLRLRSVLVVAEIAISAMLLVSAAVIVRSLLRLEMVDLGFEPDHAVSMSFVLMDMPYPTAAKMRGFVHALLDEIRSAPGMRAAAVSTAIPLQGHLGWVNPITAAGANINDLAAIRLIAGDYFASVGTPLLRGRAFSVADSQTSARVAIINQSTARKYFADADPIGKSIKLGRPDSTDDWRTVVGIVSDSKQRDLDIASDPEVFLPLDQLSDKSTALAARGLYLVMRSDAGDPTILIPYAKSAITRLDAGLPLNDVQVLRQLVSTSVAQPRFRTFLFSLFGALALVLAAVGLYGVLTYAVAQRTREFGIRIALGANRPDLLLLVLRQGGRLVAIGLLLGLAGAVAAGGALRQILFAIGPNDPATLAGALATIACIAALATLAPARRAMRSDPMAAIRYE